MAENSDAPSEAQRPKLNQVEVLHDDPAMTTPLPASVSGEEDEIGDAVIENNEGDKTVEETLPVEDVAEQVNSACGDDGTEPTPSSKEPLPFNASGCELPESMEKMIAAGLVKGSTPKAYVEGVEAVSWVHKDLAASESTNNESGNFKSDSAVKVNYNTHEDWTHLNLHPDLLEAVRRLPNEILAPTPIQIAAITSLCGKDFGMDKSPGRCILMEASSAGGKTLAFLIPMLNWIVHQVHRDHKRGRGPPIPISQGSRDFFTPAYPYGLIICPTNPLVQQHTEVATMLVNSLNTVLASATYPATHKSTTPPFIKGVQVSGDIEIDAQLATLNEGAQLIIATPGRLKDMLDRKRIQFWNLHTVVFDEAGDFLKVPFNESDWSEFHGDAGINRYLDTLAPDCNQIFVAPFADLAARDPDGNWLKNPQLIQLRSGEDQMSFVNVLHQVMCLPHVNDFNNNKHCPNENLKLGYNTIKQVMFKMQQSDCNIRSIVAFCNTKRDVDFLEALVYHNGDIKFPVHQDGNGFVSANGTPIQVNSERKLPFVFALHHDRRENGSVRQDLVTHMRDSRNVTLVLCTDILGSGFDDAVDVVINVRLPRLNEKTSREQCIQEFKSRASRTGRWVGDGLCLSLFEPEVDDYAADTLIELLQKQGNSVPSFLIDAQARYAALYPDFNNDTAQGGENENWGSGDGWAVNASDDSNGNQAKGESAVGVDDSNNQAVGSGDEHPRTPELRRSLTL